MTTAAKFFQPVPIFLAYLIQLDVDATGNITEKFVKLEVNSTFFAPWLPWQRPPFLIYSTPQQLPHTTVDIPTKFHERNPKLF